jgi:hypothetical protein
LKKNKLHFVCTCILLNRYQTGFFRVRRRETVRPQQPEPVQEQPPQQQQQENIQPEQQPQV